MVHQYTNIQKTKYGSVERMQFFTKIQPPNCRDFARVRVVLLQMQTVVFSVRTGG